MVGGGHSHDLNEQPSAQLAGPPYSHLGRRAAKTSHPLAPDHSQGHPMSQVSALGLPVYSESVRYLLVRDRYSANPARSSGTPRATTLKSRSRSKRFGSGWLWGSDLCLTLWKNHAPRPSPKVPPSQGSFQGFL